MNSRRKGKVGERSLRTATINSRTKGKRGEREFAALLREHGFDARRGQQFAGGADSPDVVSDALAWIHFEIKRVQHLNLAAACAQAKRDCAGKPWVVAHRRNHAPWFITMDGRDLHGVLRTVAPYLDVWPFMAPHITMEAELFFQFLRELQRRIDLDEDGSWLATPRNKAISEVSSESPDTAEGTVAAPLTIALPENQPTEQTKQTEQ